LISDLSLKLAFSLTQQKAVTGWPPIEQGPVKVNGNLVDVDLTKWDEPYVAALAISSGANQVVDLQNFPNLVGDTGVVLTKVFLILLEVDVSTIHVTPGSPNGLDYVHDLTVGPGIFLMTALPTDVVGFTVDGTHKTIKFDNVGGVNMTGSLIIVGGT
jgi:hypothetical protein